MRSLFNANGLAFWTSEEVRKRNELKDYYASFLGNALREVNRAFQIYEVETPQLTPQELINPNYTADDVYVLDGGLVLRPETTPGTYAAARYLLDYSDGLVAPPVCVWQAGKSFRREQDQPTKFVRLKEFYQQEFQCIFTDDTANDYHAALLPYVQTMIGNSLPHLRVRVVESDRLPSYSRKTMDIEVDNGDRWMEVCSISLRTDFPGKARFTGKKGTVEKGLLVVEVAVGLDRCVYNFFQGNYGGDFFEKFTPHRCR